MITRTLGGILRGNSTALQIFLACVLGMALGFVPDAMHAIGSIVFLTLLIIILNVNLALVLLAALAGKVLSWVMIIVSFHLGRLLLDGPTQGWFKSAINAPVLAFFGLEYYVVSGGLLLGLVLGAVAGWGVIRAITAFRRRMSGMEESSERFKKLNAYWYVRVLVWIFAGGGHGKLTYAQLLQRRIGNPIRTLGVVAAALLVVLLMLVKSLFSGPIVAAYLQTGLERLNGATVDIGEIHVGLKDGQLTLKNVAMADPEALDTDLLRAARVEGKLSTADLLRKRLKVDRIVLSDAVIGAKRRMRGQRVAWPASSPWEAPALPDWQKLEDYLKTAQKWKDRLQQARQWLEKLSGMRPARGETLQQRIERLIRSDGYASVYAAHLIEGAPRFHLGELLAEKVRADLLGDETLDIRATDLSTDPDLLDAPPAVTIRSSRQTLDFALSLDESCAKGGRSGVRMACRNLSADAIAAQLADSGGMKGGLVDFTASGTWDAATRSIDLPLQVALRNIILPLPGGLPRSVSKLAFPMTVSGVLDSPRVRIDRDALVKAMKDAGLDDLAGQAREEAARQAQKATGKIPVNLKDALQKWGGSAIDRVGPASRPD